MNNGRGVPRWFHQNYPRYMHVSNLQCRSNDAKAKKSMEANEALLTVPDTAEFACDITETWNWDELNVCCIRVSKD